MYIQDEYVLNKLFQENEREHYSLMLFLYLDMTRRNGQRRIYNVRTKDAPLLTKAYNLERFGERTQVQLSLNPFSLFPSLLFPTIPLSNN